ncbi:hypothetical protein JCM10212_001175 [Sporobolomyces blumeae]
MPASPTSGPGPSLKKHKPNPTPPPPPPPRPAPTSPTRPSTSTSASRRVTRSQSRAYDQARADRQASVSTGSDLELVLDSEEGDDPFEYESDFGSADLVDDGNGQDDDDDEIVDAEMTVREEDGFDDADKTLVVATPSDAESVDVNDEPPAEPPKSNAGKGKMTARKQFALDVAHLAQRFDGTNSVVRAFARDEGEDTIRFLLHLPAPSQTVLRLCLMFPELSGYPSSHEVMCFAENEQLDANVELVLSEVAQLPRRADRSLNGIIEYLLTRIVQGEASPYATKEAKESQGANETDEDFDYEDDLVIMPVTRSDDLSRALRRDFKELIKEGFRPGFTRLSDFDLVVSVSKTVHSLGVPVRALEAWDSNLITGQTVYLVLLINFGATYPVNIDGLKRGEVQFKVGISPKYKPSRAAIGNAFRSRSSSIYTKGDFEAISLSVPLDSLFLNEFHEILSARRWNESCGWAAAELHSLADLGQASSGIDKKAGKAADKAEKEIAKSHQLPSDPMAGSKTCNNYPLLAFSYLLRRFILCPRFCLICYKRCDQTVSALKPFVCGSSLCLYQLISLGLGPSLEHEITTNASAVDLLVQLAYVSAREGGLKGDLLPNGLSLEVPETRHDGNWRKGDPVVEFDSLPSDVEKQRGVAALILELPPINEMKRWLLCEDLTEGERAMNRLRKLSDMRDGSVSTSAWRLLRFIVASNTSYLKLIEDDDELVEGVPKDHRQFRLVVGDPAKEHLLAQNVKRAQTKDPNASSYPTLFAWHGSSVKNWSAILREGLHFKQTVNGRAYGHGVYFAIDGNVSLGTYAQPATTSWKNADFPISKMAALCEIVNLPKEYVSSNPYLVVDKVDWIQCRYLIISRHTTPSLVSTEASLSDDASRRSARPSTARVPIKKISLDPIRRPTLGNAKIAIPDVVEKLEKMEADLDDTKEELNESDLELLKEPSVVQLSSSGSASPKKPGRVKRTASALDAPGSQKKGPVEDSFIPCDDARLGLIKMLPPPANPNRSAMMTIRREMKQLLEQQELEGSVEAGFYFDPERSNDNLFTWIIEFPRGSFDQDLPLVKDMKAKRVESILLEVRFGESFPFSPPFFRVVHPRFLPFMYGGGGHVTGGGSICMDLLTTDGWAASYSVSAVFLQIRMAMSNLEPRPARLDPSQWNSPYSMEEAIAGFKRAAATHGWKVPAELEQIARGG